MSSMQEPKKIKTNMRHEVINKFMTPCFKSVGKCVSKNKQNCGIGNTSNTWRACGKHYFQTKMLTTQGHYAIINPQSSNLASKHIPTSIKNVGQKNHVGKA